VNQRPTANDDPTGAGRGRRAPIAARALRAGLAGLGLALCAFAQSPGGASGLERLVANDAAALLDSRDAETRGEAALVVAAAGDVRHEARLLELADDPAPAARQRATVALGLLATTAATQKLEERLRTVDGRTGDDAVATAYALGLVPTDRVHTSVARTLPLFVRGSWKRQHDVLLALLLAMTQHDERGEQRALRDLYENDNNRRSPDLRALLLDLLLPLDRSFDERFLETTLRRGSDEERLAVLRWLANQTPQKITPWLEELERIAVRDDLPPHRTAALLALTRCRHLPALEIAARALRSESPEECAQGMQSMLMIGGASTRGALEQHLLDERDPVRKAALLGSFKAPPSTRLADHAAELAKDARQPMPTRVAAAELLARSKPQRAVAVLRDLFRTCHEPELLERIARALQHVETDPTELARLLDLPVQLTKHPERWRALLAAGHGEAERQLLAVLQDRSANPRDVRTALKAWRSARVLTAPEVTGIETPDCLQQLLR